MMQRLSMMMVALALLIGGALGQSAPEPTGTELNAKVPWLSLVPSRCRGPSSEILVPGTTRCA